jgi:hypothetical protein
VRGPDVVDPTYSTASIDRLIDGQVFAGIAPDDPADWIEVDGSWADIRAQIERSGAINSEAFLAVLDLEAAISVLRSHDPAAAATVVLTLFGFDEAEIRAASPGLRRPMRCKNDAKSFIADWMNGNEDAEANYDRRQTRRKRSA